MTVAPADQGKAKKKRVASMKDSNVVPLRVRRRMAVPPKGNPRILLLQGPVGSFFKNLSQHLERAGYEVWRVSFNAGDRLFADRNRLIEFSGSLEEWEAWLRSFAKAAELDCIVLFGCYRPIHVRARAVAGELDLPVLSLEEGYIRPGFITAEFGGNNAASPLARMLPPADFVPSDHDYRGTQFNSFPSMCRLAATYFVTRTLFSGLGSRQLFHRRFNPLVEPFLWGRNWWRSQHNRARDFQTLERLLEHHDGRYFLIPLQVPNDAQLGEPARGWTSQRLITEAIGSFARTAPSNYRLVLKIHPLDRGHSNARRFVRQVAEVFKLSDRVDVLENCSLGLLTRHAAGMITINSTSGLSAIHHGIPLMVVGEAIYSHPKLATIARTSSDFDRFWTNPSVPSPDLRRRYLGWLREEALVAGDFYVKEGMDVASHEIVKKVGLCLNVAGQLGEQKKAC